MYSNIHYKLSNLYWLWYITYLHLHRNLTSIHYVAQQNRPNDLLFIALFWKSHFITVCAILVVCSVDNHVHTYWLWFSLYHLEVNWCIINVGEVLTPLYIIHFKCVYYMGHSLPQTGQKCHMQSENLILGFLTIFGCN